MFKKFLWGLCLAAVFPLVAPAQRYVLDYHLSDSVSVYKIITAESGSEVCGVEAFKLPLGETVTVERTLSGSESYGLVRIGGVPYAISDSQLLFSDDNKEGTTDIFGDTRSRVQHTWVGKWFASYTPYLLISLLFVVAMVFAFGGLGNYAMRRLAIVIVPVCILIASLFEIWAYSTLGKDAFWWCDKETYGFWISLLRVIPFVVFVVFQIYSIKLYEILLFGFDSGKKISIKPMAIGLVICIPVVFLLAFLMPSFGIRGRVHDIISVAGLLGCALGGILWSLVKNVRTLGVANGIIFTAFSVVYVVGSLIAVWGLLMALIQMILQILLVLALVCGGGRAVPVEKMVSNPNRYRSLDGHDYESDQARLHADIAWKRMMGRE